MTKLGIALAFLLWGTVARADPEGYHGGDGRPVGTPFAPSDGMSMTVLRMSVVATVADDHWECGGRAQPPGRYVLVTIAIELSNATTEPVSTFLNTFDLVIGRAKKNVAEGTCTRTARVDDEDVPLAPKKRRIVRTQFLIPRGEWPQVLVYNNDDFPTLFALPKRTTHR